MDKRIINFDDRKIEEYKFHQYKSSISINQIDIDIIVVSNKFPFGKQVFIYLIDYKDNKKFKPLCIFFPETNVYKKDLDETKCMYSLLKDKEFLEKYNEILERVSNTTKKINSELIW